MQESTKITDQWINSADHERDFLKDLIYLQEEIIDLNKEINERLEAKIFIIDEDKILNDGKIRSNLLPF